MHPSASLLSFVHSKISLNLQKISWNIILSVKKIQINGLGLTDECMAVREAQLLSLNTTYCINMLYPLKLENGNRNRNRTICITTSFTSTWFSYNYAMHIWGNKWRNNMLCNMSHKHCAQQIKRVTAICRFTTSICPRFSLTDSKLMNG